MAKAHGLWAARPSRMVFLSLSLSAKERGPGGEFRALLNREVREERYILFLFFPWRPPRPLRFQVKSVKMNFDDPLGGSG